jgi:isoleucyl-tRNA synthetase
VHIAPGHGLDDYLLGMKNGLPIYSPVDDDGKFAHTNDLPLEQQMPAEMLGKSILEKHGKSDANEAVLHELRVRKALLHQENYHHSYPHCWRSKTPIIFRAMDQWFIRIDHAGAGVRRLTFSGVQGGTLAAGGKESQSLVTSSPTETTFRQQALAAIEGVKWIPDWGKSRIEAAVKSRPDWCISRQRAWGVPIPAFYDAQGNAILDAQIVRNAADLIEKQGSNVWFEKSAAELWAALKPKDWSGSEAASKSNDTLDVWIDSGSSSRSVLMRRPELQRALVAPKSDEGGTRTTQHAAPAWQADMYLEGSDQHRGWFQSSLLLSLAGNGVAPYRTVLTHGFMVDADREKISKSKGAQGAYEKPQTSEAYIKKYGADIIRLWVASQDFRNDIIVSEERIKTVAETYRVLRNALRYQLSNLYDFDPAKHSVPDDKLTKLDRWILSEFSKLEQELIKAYDDCEFHVVYQKVSQFVAVELSAMYHDTIKDRLYTDAANSPRRRSTQTALHRLAKGLCQFLSPVLVFTAEEAWEFIPAASGSVHEAKLDCVGLTLLPEERDDWEWLADWRGRALPELEKRRQDKMIGKALDAKVSIVVSVLQFSLGERNRESLRELLNVSQLEVEAGEAAAVAVLKADGEKCERCWHWETDVGSHAGHPTICGRCVKAVS